MHGHASVTWSESAHLNGLLGTIMGHMSMEEASGVPDTHSTRSPDSGPALLDVSLFKYFLPGNTISVVNA